MSARFLQERRAGVLLHPTSLPTGTLGHDAERWLDLLHDAGISVWQVLPLGDELSPSPGYVSDPVGDLAATGAPGVLEDVDDPQSLISFLDRSDLDKLRELPLVTPSGAQVDRKSVV